jgi:hypothetical protein
VARDPPALAAAGIRLVGVTAPALRPNSKNRMAEIGIPNA